MAGMRPLTKEQVSACLDRLASEAKPRDTAMFLFGLKTGFRASEITSVLIEDVWEHGEIKSHIRLDKARMKGGKPAKAPARRKGHVKHCQCKPCLRLDQPKTHVAGCFCPECHPKPKHVTDRTVILHPDARTALKVWIDELRLRKDFGPLLPVFVSRTRNKDQSARAVSRVQLWRILTRLYTTVGITGNHGCHGLRKSFGMSVFFHTNHNVLAAQKALGHSSIQSTMAYLSVSQDEVDRAILAA